MPAGYCGHLEYSVSVKGVWWVQVNAKDIDGYTALMHASEYNAVDVVRVLLEHGAEVGVLDPCPVATVVTSSTL